MYQEALNVNGVGWRLSGRTMCLLALLAFFSLVAQSWCINCYTCSSVNGSEPFCEDPIDTSLAPLAERCQVPKNNHRGLFPANFCLKIVGKNVATYERLVIRACAMKSMDSQCGVFRYEEAEMSGCVLTCENSGCNLATPVSNPSSLTTLLLPLIIPLFLSCNFSWCVSRHRTLGNVLSLPFYL